RNVVSRKSSLVIVLFIACSISLLCLSNAVFDGTDSGLERTFINSFTGDVVIRPRSNMSLSLFGDDTPIMGEFSSIPSLIPYRDVSEYVSAMDDVEAVLPQVSGYAAIKGGDHSRSWLNFFGVEAEDYVPRMNGIRVTAGGVYRKGEAGLMLSRGAVNALKRSFDMTEDPAIGEKFQVLTSNGATINVRLVTLTGIYEYVVDNATMNKIALISPDVLRDLLDLSTITADEDINPNDMDLLNGSFDSIEDLFADADDTVGVEAAEQDFGRSADASGDDAGQAAAAFGTADGPAVGPGKSDSMVWAYLVIKLKKAAKTRAVIRRLNQVFNQRDWPVQAANWRTAAGGTVAMVFFLRLVMNVGIILILLTGFIVVANTLMISSLSRMTETGTLRAIGAKRGFILLQFFWETALLTLTAGILGCLLGSCFCMLVNSAGIELHNSLLVQLFGGNSLRCTLLPTNISLCMGVAVALTFIGWYFPVRIAMEANPIVAMRGQI
ncbi:MAG: FtsX-like permease family protein, partial [Treponema sp.]|nr:FtsX-like permease family protein [Treponema sp.]